MSFVLMTRVELRVNPFLSGVNVTAMVQVAPAFTGVATEQVPPVTTNRGLFPPEVAMLVKDNAALPVFDTVTDKVLGVPAGTSP